MTQEERETIKERYAVRDVDKYPCRAAFSGVCPSGRDVKVLLAALDEMEADRRMSVNAAALSIKHLKTARDLHKRRAETLDVELRADRDRWKERAEALERAIKGLPIGKVSCPACKLCDSYDYAYAGTLRSCTNKTATCGINNGYNSWQFDEARFSGEHFEKDVE